MFYYWLLAILPAVLSFQNLKDGRGSSPKLGITWSVFLVLALVFVGLRYQVGTDWPNYLRHYYGADGQSFIETLLDTDPGYSLINWIAFRLGAGLIFVNFICALVFFAGLAQFCRRQPFPWLAVTVAIPYLVIVVAMGYTRQSVAIALTLYATTNLISGRNKSAILFITLAAFFHRSAVIMFPFVALSNAKRRITMALSSAALASTFFFLFIYDSVDSIYFHYAERQLGSQGALVRIMMNLVPAVVFLIWGNRLEMVEGEKRFWWWTALACVALVGLLYVSPSSTAVDRIALYFIPMQIVVLGRVPLLSKRDRDAIFLKAVVVIYSIAIMFTWLNYANNADSWLPYTNYLFIDDFE